MQFLTLPHSSFIAANIIAPHNYLYLLVFQDNDDDNSVPDGNDVSNDPDDVKQVTNDDPEGNDDDDDNVDNLQMVILMAKMMMIGTTCKEGTFPHVDCKGICQRMWPAGNGHDDDDPTVQFCCTIYYCNNIFVINITDILDL